MVTLSNTCEIDIAAAVDSGQAGAAPDITTVEIALDLKFDFIQYINMCRYVSSSRFTTTAFCMILSSKFTSTNEEDIV